MGASDFQNDVQKRPGLTMAQAFDEAVQQARYDYGHAGYTGSIAEKSGYVAITPPAKWTDLKLWNALHELEDYRWREADRQLDARRAVGVITQAVQMEPLAAELVAAVGRTTADSWVDLMSDKWGPALAFETETHFVFFGYASS